MPQFRIKNGPEKGRIFKLEEEHTTIGRDVSAGIQVNDSGASREHAEAFKIGEMFFIRDQESRNGTYVNDEEIKEELLREGDRLQIGNTILVFESQEHAQDKDNIEFSEPSSGDDLGTTMEIKLHGAGEMEGINPTNASDQLKIMYQLGKLMTTEKNSHGLLKKILALIAKVIKAENIYIFIKDSKTGKLIPRARREKDPSKKKKISRSIIKRALQDSRAVLTSDAMSDTRFRSQDSIVMNKIHSVLCVPLVSMSRVAGVLYMDSTELGFSFKEEDLELASAISFQVGVAVNTIITFESQQKFFLNVVKSLISAGEMRDPKIKGHFDRVYTYATAIGKRMNLTANELKAVQVASLLHDVGMLAVSDISDMKSESYLNEHVLYGEKVIKNMKELSYILPGVKYHHEKWDGTGIPEGLKGDDIPVSARIIAVANQLDHLLNWGGELGGGLPIKDALLAIKDMAGTEFDSRVVSALVIAHRDGILYESEPLFLQQV